MSGLILKLNPKERVLINGAVIENGDRRSKFRIMTPKANVLRLRDAINPEKSKHACAQGLLYDPARIDRRCRPRGGSKRNSGTDQST